MAVSPTESNGPTTFEDLPVEILEKIFQYLLPAHYDATIRYPLRYNPILTIRSLNKFFRVIVGNMAFWKEDFELVDLIALRCCRYYGPRRRVSRDTIHLRNHHREFVRVLLLGDETIVRQLGERTTWRFSSLGCLAVIKMLVPGFANNAKTITLDLLSGLSDTHAVTSLAITTLTACKAVTRLNISNFRPYIALEFISVSCPHLEELQLYWPDRTIREPGLLKGRLCHSECFHLPHLESLTIVDATRAAGRDYRNFLPLASKSCLKKLSLVFEWDSPVNSTLIHEFTKLNALYLRPVPVDQLASLSEKNIFLSDFRVELQWFHFAHHIYSIFTSRTLHRLKHLRLSIRTYGHLWIDVIKAVTKNLTSLETLYLEVPVTLMELEEFDLSPLSNLKRIHIFICITRSTGRGVPGEPPQTPPYFTM